MKTLMLSPILALLMMHRASAAVISVSGDFSATFDQQESDYQGIPDILGNFAFVCEDSIVPNSGNFTLFSLSLLSLVNGNLKSRLNGCEIIPSDADDFWLLRFSYSTFA